MPFANLEAWEVAQKDCADVRRAKAHLQQGTLPNKKSRKLQDVRKYHKTCSRSRDGLLIVNQKYCHSA